VNLSKRKAILVGVDTYKFDFWPPLHYVAGDIKGPHGLEHVLSHDLGSYCFSKEDIEVFLGSDALSTNIEARLTELCISGELGPDDQLLFYFSGHGSIHPLVDLPLLVTHETDPQIPHKTGLTFSFVQSLAKRTKATLIVAVDTCFSGRLAVDAFSEGTANAEIAANQLTKLPGVALFASCQAEQRSGPAPQKGQSLFTKSLIAGLRGDGMALRSGRVDTESLKDYLFRNFDSHSQKPVIMVPKEPIVLSIPNRPLMASTGVIENGSNYWEGYAQEVPVYVVTPTESSINFGVESSVSIKGIFEKWSTSIQFSSRDVRSATLDIEIEAGSVNTGSHMKDNKLKGKDFFNVKESPLITFKSTKIVQSGPNTFDVEGNFTIRGVTKTEKLTFTSEGKGSPSGSLEGTMAFDRKDYGMTSGIPFIRIANRVEVDVRLKWRQISGPPPVFQQ
jgi:polyisoprenoid-binding protein YceI